MCLGLEIYVYCSCLVVEGTEEMLSSYLLPGGSVFEASPEYHPIPTVHAEQTQEPKRLGGEAVQKLLGPDP